MALKITDLKQVDSIEVPQINDIVRTAMEQLSVTASLARQFTAPSFAEVAASARLHDIFTSQHRDTIRNLLESTKPLSQWMSAAAISHEHYKQLIEPALHMQNLAAEFAKSTQAINYALESCRLVMSFEKIGSSLAKLFPYENRVTDLLRSNLGDWRSVEFPRQDLWLEETAREDLYKRVGFDFSLTDLGRDRLVDSMDGAGIRIGAIPAPAKIYGRQPIQKSGLVLPVLQTGTPPENIEAYELLWALETRIREFIDRSMMRHFGEDWHKRGLAPEILKQWREKRECDVDGGMAAQPLISYADFTDYEKIIVRRDHWRDVFCGVFKCKESVIESFNRLRLLRVVVMHARPLSNEDLLMLHAEVRRVLKAISFVSH